MYYRLFDDGQKQPSRLATRQLVWIFYGNSILSDEEKQFSQKVSSPLLPAGSRFCYSIPGINPDGDYCIRLSA